MVQNAMQVHYFHAVCEFYASPVLKNNWWLMAINVFNSMFLAIKSCFCGRENSRTFHLLERLNGAKWRYVFLKWM